MQRAFYIALFQVANVLADNYQNDHQSIIIIKQLMVMFFQTGSAISLK